MSFLMAMKIQTATLNRFAVAAAMVIDISCGGFCWVRNTNSPFVAAKKVIFAVFLDNFLLFVLGLISVTNLK